MPVPADQRWRRLRVWLFPYLGLVAVHLLVGANGYYPTVHPDEVIYREMARYLAGAGPVPNLGDTFVFPIGYPLLVSPLFRLFDGFESLGFALLLVNSLLASAVALPVIAFTRRILGASERTAVAAALVVGVYPAYLAITGMTLTQHAFVPLYAMLVVLAGALYRRPTVALGLLLGLGTAALFAIHERALLVMAVAVVQVAFLAAIGQVRKRVAALAIAGAVLGLAAVKALQASTYAAVYRGEGVERPLTQVVLAKFLSAEGWLDFFLQVAGQAWYLLVATYGLAGIGLALLVERLWMGRSDLWRRGPRTADLHAVLFLLATAGAIFGVCAVYFPENPIMPANSEFYFFGRINEGFLPLLFAAGLVALAPDRQRSWVKPHSAVPISVLVLCVLGAVMVWGRGMEALADDPRTYGVFGVRWFLRDNQWLVSPFLGSVLMAVLWVGLYRLLRRRSRLLFAVVGLSFLVISMDLSLHYFSRRQQRQYRRTLPSHLAAAGAGVVAMDTVATRTGRWAEMIRRVEVRNFDDRRGETPDAPLVISRRRWENAERHGARFLAGERDVRYALWALPGPEQERLYRPPDYRTVVFGAQSIWSVWERGFCDRELWRGAEPMRWTERRAYLRIPFAGRPPPVLLHVDLAAAAQEETELDIEVDGRELVEVDIPPDGWSRTFRLGDLRGRDEVTVRIKSTRSRHPGRLYGKVRPYDRGVLVRGVTLFDAEEAAAITRLAGAEAAAGPLRYRLSSIGGKEEWEAVSGEPLVVVLSIGNTGGDAWPGRLGGGRNPRLVAGWYSAGGPPAVAAQVEVPRLVLPGRELHLPIAVDARDGSGAPLPPGDYQLRLVTMWPDGRAAAGNPVLALPVTVTGPSPEFFAPLARALAWRARPPEPPFTLMPF